MKKKKQKTVAIDSINIDGVEIKVTPPIEIGTEPCSFEEAIEDMPEDQQKMYKNLFNFFIDDKNFQPEKGNQ